MKWVPLTKDNVRVGDVVRVVPSEFNDSTARTKGLNILHIGIVYNTQPIEGVGVRLYVKVQDHVWWTSCPHYYLTLRGG